MCVCVCCRSDWHLARIHDDCSCLHLHARKHGTLQPSEPCFSQVGPRLVASFLVAASGIRPALPAKLLLVALDQFHVGAGVLVLGWSCVVGRFDAAKKFIVLVHVVVVLVIVVASLCDVDMLDARLCCRWRCVSVDVGVAIVGMRCRHNLHCEPSCTCCHVLRSMFMVVSGVVVFLLLLAIPAIGGIVIAIEPFLDCAPEDGCHLDPDFLPCKKALGKLSAKVKVDGWMRLSKLHETPCLFRRLAQCMSGQ